MRLFLEKRQQYNGVANLFHFIVNTKHPAYKRRPQPLTGKISYQPEGMNLQRVDFVPNNEDQSSPGAALKIQGFFLCTASINDPSLCYASSALSG